MKTTPNAADAQNQLGIGHLNRGEHEKALNCFKRATKLDPQFAAAHNNLGGALVELGRPEKAIASFKSALQLNASYAQAHQNMGVALRMLRRHSEAISHFERALRLKPDDADTHNNLGIAFAELAQYEQAAACYTRALALKPDFADAHNNLGNALKAQGRLDDAIPRYMRALQINPRFAMAYNNLGLALRQLRRADEAVECFSRALTLNPQLADAHLNLGVALADLRRPEDAVQSFSRALEIQPEMALARAQRMHQRARLCDWAGLEADRQFVDKLGTSGGVVPPFAMLSLDDHPMRQRIRAERFAAATYPPRPRPSFLRPAAKPDRLRIGYFSADYSNHATMFLMAGLFEHHDRSRFALHAYSYGPDVNDAMRARVKNTFDVFHDVRLQSDEAIAELARSESIDVAVDLSGYAERNRAGVFWHGAAPIQISYLGYPGTIGAPFFDYLVADRTLIPNDTRSCYAESIIYMPHTYQVNDSAREISDRVFTRAEAGLPDPGFVFCSFNNSYKISSIEFDIWMRLLQRVDGSVLWLLGGNASVEANLRSEAAKRGVDPARIVFAKPAPLSEHLARHRLADLFLDTFNYNAHTTASDALWAGLPLVTKLGQSFAARVAGSLLTAIDMAMLVTDTAESYERLAFELATDPARLGAIRQRLHANRGAAPLFDTDLFARHIEAAYERTYQRYLDGEPAADFAIDP
ncbi:MAG: tetratricopeptide repeat protein [Phycisphaerales bacterium]|nr:tetratricopeptide repeat protein [Hyphomonadaceae bacterium]